MQAVRDLLTPRPLPEPDESEAVGQRRRRVVAVTLVAGTLALGATLAAPRGSLAFTLLGFLVAGIWLTGAVATGPLDPAGLTAGESAGGPATGAGATSRLDAGPTGAADSEGEADRVVGDRTDAGGWGRRVGEAVAAVGLGGLTFVGFLGASVVASWVPALDGAVDSVLAKAEAGTTAVVLAVAVLNAVAEEVFFRGALPLALSGPRRAAVAVAVYVLVTVATLNVALVLAAVVMGTVLMAERLATRGVMAPVLTHVTWSILMLLAFPG